MERKAHLLRDRGAEIVAVGPGSHAAAERVRGLLRVGFPVFGDPRLEVYTMFGYGRVLAIVRQSGTVVVDRDGIVAMVHRTANPFDALPFDEVLATLDRFAPTTA